MGKELTISYDVADGIALNVMQDHLVSLKTDVTNHVENGSYMHPEDYNYFMTKLIPSLEILIDYFGGKTI